MRQVGSKRERTLAMNASGVLLAEGARFNEAISRLSQTTFVPKGNTPRNSPGAGLTGGSTCSATRSGQTGRNL